MANQTKWVSDPTHSEILFKVRHMMITNVKGEFRKFNATLLTDGDDFSKGTAEVTIDPSSVFTNTNDRDNHLKSADFLHVDNHKEIKFTSTSFTKLDDENYSLKGILEIKGVKKEITLDVEFGGLKLDPWGKMRAGFSITGKINRKDWGLNWNTALEAGGVLVGEEVKISAEVEFTKEEA
ncbi:MAG: YceI family protein [Chitinophagaceae bacterium]|nr:YceI family protein [Chitinophagaceae bacterium]